MPHHSTRPNCPLAITGFYLQKSMATISAKMSRNAGSDRVPRRNARSLAPATTVKPPMHSLTKIAFEDLPPALADALEARVKRLGYFGEFFQYAALQPEALKAFVDFTELAKAGVPKKLVEIVALTCAGWMGNAYETNQHERLSIRSGFGHEWLRAVEQCAPENQAEMSEHERLVQQFVLATLDSRGHGSGALFEAVVAAVGEAPAIAILMIIGRYVVHGLFVNTLGLAPPVPSIWEDGFQQ